jgi:hypothetical protein
MVYSDFTLDQIEELGITLNASQRLFAEVAPVAPSAWLRQTLDTFLPMATAVNSEKVRSEFIIAPILGEVKQRSGEPVSSVGEACALRIFRVLPGGAVVREAGAIAH